MWEQVTLSSGWSARDEPGATVFNNSLWLMGGSGGGFKSDVWSSRTGYQWTRVTTSAGWQGRMGHTSIEFNGKLWVIGGRTSTSGAAQYFKNDVWSTSDGIQWNSVAANAIFSPRFRSSCVVYNSSLWLLGGASFAGQVSNDVYSSSDGLTWTQQTAAAGWNPRYSHAVLVFKQKIWVMGGVVSGSRRNDVWWSTNGINWTQATAGAAWSGRAYMGSTVYKDKMWVAGGLDTAYRNDVWFSTNGADWTSATSAAAWSGRFLSSGLHALHNKMWVVGSNGEVWYTNSVTSLPTSAPSLAPTYTPTNSPTLPTFKQFNYTGQSEMFVVPPGTVAVSVWACGGNGASYGNNTGGLGACLSCMVSAAEYTELVVTVGQYAGSLGGGGAGSHGLIMYGGGASSVILMGASGESNITVLVGGGGGAAGSVENSKAINGGNGGLLRGENGVGYDPLLSVPAGGGNNTAGGTMGIPHNKSNPAYYGSPGSLTGGGGGSFYWGGGGGGGPRLGADEPSTGGFISDWRLRLLVGCGVAKK